jgi:hypothetical protein
MEIPSHIVLHKNVMVKALFISVKERKALSPSSHYEQHEYDSWNCSAEP